MFFVSYYKHKNSCKSKNISDNGIVERLRKNIMVYINNPLPSVNPLNSNRFGTTLNSAKLKDSDSIIKDIAKFKNQGYLP